MTSILDDFPYPWHERAAQQLHVTLSQLYPTAQSAQLVVQKAGVDTGFIDFQQAPIYIWQQVLQQAANAGLTRQLVEEVANVLGERNPRRQFFDDLLADRTPPTEGERRSVEGEPQFIKHTDEITELEAKLYHDDLTLQVGRLPSLITTLQRMVSLAPAVCRLEVDVNGTAMQGTGFRIAPDLLLTNWHVLHKPGDGTRATTVTAEFGYEDDGRGGVLQASPVPCDVGSIVTSQEDDWAIIRATGSLLDSWPVVKLSEHAPLAANSTAFIIQHPAGARKRVGFVRNQVSDFDERIVHYVTDTQEGSSGAPVFNADGRLIAVHHASGRPQVAVGKPPMKKNEGIRIPRIIEGLEKQGVTVP